MNTFKHPQDLCSFSYPAEWTETTVVSTSAFFAAQGFGGELLFEAFAMAGPNPDATDTIRRVMNAITGALRSEHPALSVLSPQARVDGCACPCEMTRVAYSEKVAGRFLKVRTVTDLYVLANGKHALGLFFKVAEKRHRICAAAFEQVALSARLHDSQN